MKKALLLAGSVLLFAACTEKGYNVTPRVEGGDTTYLAATESAQQRVVLIEEYTGVTCPNCPNGHALVATLQAQYAGRLLAVSYYGDVSPQAKPIEGHTKEDFRITDAVDIASTIFGGVAGLPIAGIDRVKKGADVLVFQNFWAGDVEKRMAVASPVNVSVTSQWSAGDRTAIIRVSVAYTSAVTKKQALTLMLTENDLVDAQESVNPDPNSNDPLILENYTFKHVLRDIITPVTGEAMLDEFAIKEAGRVYERTFVYPVSDKWKADKCTLIAIVHNAETDNKEVVQAAEAKLVE